MKMNLASISVTATMALSFYAALSGMRSTVLSQENLQEIVQDVGSNGSNFDVYSQLFGNNKYSMGNKSNSTFNDNKDEIKCMTWMKTLDFMIYDEILETGANYRFFDFLDGIRNKNEYSRFLQAIRVIKNYTLCNAVLLFLAQKDFNSLYGEEELFVVEMLKVQDDCVQEFALNALLLWDSTTQIEILRSIRLSASYLQEELNEFLEEHD